MPEKFVLSSSSKDRHGVSFSKELLEDGANSINNEDKMRYLVSHRREYPLIGYIDNAEVVEKDTIFLLMAEQISYIDREEVLWDHELVSERPRHPFKLRCPRPIDHDFLITVDPNNFGTPQNYFSLVMTLKEALDEELEIKTDTRKGLIPEPRIIIGLLMAGPLWSLTKPIFKKIGDKIADDIGDGIYEKGKEQLQILVQKVKKLMLITRKAAIPKNRPLSLIFELHGEPYVELHSKTDDVDLVARGLSIKQLSKMRARLSEFCNHVEVAEAHFNLSEKGSWVFSFLITTEGVQIGKKAIFKKRDQLLKRIKLSPQYGHSIGADVTYNYQNILGEETTDHLDI
jgi:hypothetical protein